MNKEQNIESLFKNNFNRAKVKPTEELWNNISNELDKEYYFKTKFENYQTQPNSKLWINIQRRLNFIDFFRFNVNRMNIYYSILFLFATFASILYFGQFSQHYHGIKTTTSLYPQNNTRSINTINTSNEIPIHTIQNLTEERQEEYTPAKGDQINTSQVITQNNDASLDTKPLLNEEQSQTEETLFAENNNIPKVESPNNVNADNALTNNTSVNNEFTEPMIGEQLEEKNINESSSPGIMNESEAKIDYEENDLQLSIKENLLTLKNKTIQYLNYTITGPESIIRKDTICMNAFGEPIVLNHSWSVEGYVNSLYSTAIFNPARDDEPIYLNNFKDSYTSNYSLSYGINVGYHNRNFVVQSGLAYTEIHQDFSYEKLQYITDTTIITNTLTYQYERPDTVWFVDMDYYNETGLIDSIYRIDYYSADSTQVITIQKYDTTITSEKIKSLNKHKYFEIPISFGYKFRLNKFSFTPKIGLVAGFIIESTGITPSYNINETTRLSKANQPFIKPLFSWTGGLEIEYSINKSIGIVAEPYYRETITSIFDKKYPLNQNFSIKGVRFGVRYNF